MHHQTKSKLVIITGAPATGKSTLLNHLNKKLDIFSLSKDKIKEILYDSIDSITPSLNNQLGLAAFSIIFQLLAKFTKQKIPLVIEGNFRPKFGEKELSKIVKKHNLDVFQILLRTKVDKIFSRMKAREKKQSRHPKHPDSESKDLIKTQIKKGEYRHFKIPNSTNKTVNTDNLTSNIFKDIVKDISEFLG